MGLIDGHGMHQAPCNNKLLQIYIYSIQL